MPSRYRILSILLFFIVLILGYENYETWSSPSAMTPKMDTGKKGETKPDAPTPAVAPKEAAPREAFNTIAEKNVFNPDRKEFPVAEAAAGAAGAAGAKPVTRPQITLYGVVIGEDYQTASIINPGRPLHKGERETKTLKIGDMIGDYKLSKITQDRIIMEAGEDSFEVLLYDPRAPKKRAAVRTPTQPAAATSTLPTPTPPGMTQPASPQVPPLSPSPVVTPAPGTPSAPMPRPATPSPSPVPGTAGQLPEVVIPPTTSPTPSTPTDPGIWRGRRPQFPSPATPAGPSG